MKNVDLIIFDLDGVLINSFDDLADALNLTLKQMGLKTHTYEEIKKFFWKASEAFFLDALGGKENFSLYYEEFIDRYYKNHFNNCLNKTRLFPGVKEVLEHYSSKKLAVATNKNNILTEKILRELGVIDYFHAVVCPESVSKPKPDPEMIELLLEKAGVAHERAVIIGDSRSDILTGKNAGIATVGATYGFGDRQELLDEGPDFVIDKPIDLCRILL
jgi:phosphoglycolate phosphatase